MAITPRHYLDFINHYVKLFNEKRSDLEEQQLHLNVGLNKIRETVEQVEELQKSLSLKSQELEAKNALANQKLKQMVKDQQEAEKKKVTSTEIQAALNEQTRNIEEKQASVMAELSQVEPAVQEAKMAVKGIKKQHLVEVRTMGNPPPIIKVALESICLLLGQPVSDWKEIRQILMKDTFISSIVNFDTDDITDDIRKQMRKLYLSDANYTFEKVNRASLACGPLVKWAIAQISYADMLRKVEPLRNELDLVGKEKDLNQGKLSEVANMIAELERSIARYKEEYAVLISEAQAIKADLAAVEAKVSRSTALLRSLGNERQRWETTSLAFQTQMGTIAGDVLMCSAFLAYGGYFDQQLRQSLWSAWSSHLEKAAIMFKHDLARTEYLSTADERLEWQANSLPSDDLCIENAIMLKRYNRYPLIIDPSGQATKFVLNEYKAKKISRTSFLDDAFRKNLESSLRFGNPLLVQDVESYDPILNPVLNKELRRTGGRVLITIGDQDIDLSPAFTIFLSTRDPTVEFAPDLCSRVTFVNFTVTRGSLQSQCLNDVLRAERPEVDAKRSDLLKLQGEFHVRLRHLEKELLQALNDAKGRILDDDKIIGSLETLKKEAAEVTKKVEETDVIMAEVEAVSEQYRALSVACSSIYFTLESLNMIHFLYQYSLKFFLDIFESVLIGNPHLKDVKDPAARLKILTEDLFQIVYNRVARGMLHDDWVTFAVLLCRIRMRGHLGEPQYDAEFDHLLRGKEVLIGTSKITFPELSSNQNDALVQLSKLEPFAKLSDFIASNKPGFFSWLSSQNGAENVPSCWNVKEPLTRIGVALYEMMLVHAFRPDNLVSSAHKFVASVMGENFTHQAEQELDLAHVVEHEVKASTPILLCSVPGYDASGRVDDLVALTNRPCTSIAIGSAEGFSQAEKAINSSVKSGRWVLLKNVHLAPSWLVTVEKKLHTLTPHPAFRLFMTMEITPKVPVNLLRASRAFVYEPPPGIKANLLRTYNTIPAARMCKGPGERARMYFLLAWFHAIVQERLRYSPLGWSKVYEFSESDLRVACDTLDTWIDSVCQGRSNIRPDKLPWDAIRTLLGQSIYGGRIDNDFDQRLLQSFISRIFTAKSFESDFPLVLDVDGQKGKTINVPEGIRREQFLQWSEGLPDYQSPSWLGLPNNAEKVILTSLGDKMLVNVLKMQVMSEEDELAYSPEISGKREGQEGDVRPAWMKSMASSVKKWLSILPEKLTQMKRTLENIKDPLFRFFEREVNAGAKLLSDILVDLNDIYLVCNGSKKQTNHLRTLMEALVKGVIPKDWDRYTIPKGLTVIRWIADFAERIKQLQTISQAANSGGAKDLKNVTVWLGGLFIPEAYITATRQFVAQANHWSLEELKLEVTVADKNSGLMKADDCSFIVKGLKLQGAECSRNMLSLSNIITTDLPNTCLTWKHFGGVIGSTGDASSGTDFVQLPVYLNQTRVELLFTVDMKTTGEVPSRSFYERGVAFLSSFLTG